MTRLPLSRAAATALALLALACERVETKSLLTDLDRLDNVESADADPDDALPPGCRDDAPVDGCPCTGTSFHAQWGDEICDPRRLTRAYQGGEPSFRCRDGLWQFGKEQRDGLLCAQPRCFGFRYEAERETGGAITEGWPCGPNAIVFQPRCPDPERSPCMCDADGICIDRDEYEGDADTDVDLLEIIAELPEELPFDFRGRNSR